MFIIICIYQTKPMNSAYFFTKPNLTFSWLISCMRVVDLVKVSAAHHLCFNLCHGRRVDSGYINVIIVNIQSFQKVQYIQGNGWQVQLCWSCQGQHQHLLWLSDWHWRFPQQDIWMELRKTFKNSLNLNSLFIFINLSNLTKKSKFSKKIS